MVIFIILIVLMGFFFKIGTAGDALAPIIAGIEGEKIQVSMNDFFLIKFVKDFFKGFFLISNPGCVFIV
ncbi:MAG: hypothetical protein ABIH55_00115 [Nanoarchaeota archaeon]